jgi:uncharacterized protein (TIGR02466 family)
MSLNAISHRSCFPTLISTVDMADHPCESALRMIIESSAVREHSLITAGTSSHGVAELLEDPRLKELRSDIQAAVDAYSQHAGLEPLMLTGSWFNVLGKNARVSHHRHPGSVISGAYYPVLDEGSTALHFESPLLPSRMCDGISQETEFNAETIQIPVRRGLLVLFPSWLVHFTEANQSAFRATVSFNTTCRRILDAAAYYLSHRKLVRQPPGM